MVMSMNTLRVQCIRCDKQWEKACQRYWGADDLTSSLCDACFRKVISPIIRKKQLKQGSFDCFGKAALDCDQSGCKYRRWCLQVDEAA